MSAEPSVHDNFVYAYAVECEQRRIVLHTAYRDREPHEFTDIVFSEVAAHHLEHVLPANILFDVEETDLQGLIHDNAAMFEASWRHGWPAVNYRGDLRALTAALRAASIKAYAIRSSYGLGGWVLAVSCQRIARIDPATLP
jgi:hypothetical protein